MVDTEEHRHRCEVRWCIASGREWFDAYIKGVAEHRGKPAAQRLIRDVKAQAIAGSAGKWGQWIETGKPAAEKAGEKQGALL